MGFLDVTDAMRTSLFPLALVLDPEETVLKMDKLDMFLKETVEEVWPYSELTESELDTVSLQVRTPQTVLISFEVFISRVKINSRPVMTKRQ